MTDPHVLKLKAIVAMIESIDADDEEDAKTVLEMIKALLADGSKQPQTERASRDVTA